jgi:hypothetical protein
VPEIGYSFKSTIVSIGVEPPRSIFVLAFARSQRKICADSEGREKAMDVAEIIAALNVNTKAAFPAEAIEAAKTQRDALVPLFIKGIEDFTATGSTQIGSGALFFAFHLLGEWQEKSAYRLMARFLRLPEEALRPALGDAISLTTDRVMASVFDGDPEPLYDIIRDENASEFARSSMMRTIAIVTWNGEFPRPRAVQFLRDCFEQLGPEDNCVWVGWATAIAWLGLEEITPLVKQASARGSISPVEMTFEQFEDDLQTGPYLEDTLTFADTRDELEILFGDYTTDEDLSDEDLSDEDLSDEDLAEGMTDADKAEMETAIDHLVKRKMNNFGDEPVRNPFRDVGRNDPCPCGSGKKFKKCCYGADPDELMQRLAT